MLYVDELKLTLRLAISLLAALESVLLWRRSQLRVSIGLCVSAQLLLSYPHFVPSAGCVVALVFLHSTCVAGRGTAHSPPPPPTRQK